MAGVGIAGVTGAVLLYFFQREKTRMAEAKKAVQSAGKAKIGGPFSLTDTQGNVVHDTDFRGKFMLVYFGFTHCPDICPNELTKMAGVIDKLGELISLCGVDVLIQ